MNRQSRRWSIRTRLSVAHAASLCVVLVAFAVVSDLLLWNQLMNGLRRELGREFEVVESLIEVAQDGEPRWLGDDFEGEAEYEGGPIAAEVWDSSGKLLVRTAAASRWAVDKAERPWGRSVEGFYDEQIRGEGVLVLQGQHLVSGRAFLIRVTRSSKPVRDLMATFSGALLIVLLVTFVVAILISQQLVTRLFLRPLSSMALRAERITAERPGERLPIENPDDELGQLGTVINATLARFDDVAARLRRFTADASHELRTPLTSIRTVGEVALRGEQTAEAYRDVIGSILEDVESLTRLMDSLLLLSRADDAGAELHYASVPIFYVVRNVEGVMSVLAESRGQTIRVRGDENVVAAVDETVLRLALINLLDNAIKYGPDGGSVDVEISRCDEEVQIDVHDEGDGIAPEMRDRIFDRFFRVEEGRNRTIDGSGLGLSVARWAAEAHGGSLVVVDGLRKGATFRIRIPLTGAA